MSVNELVQRVPPPDRPRHAAGDWAGVEARIGLELPADYKQTVARYGAGSFSDFLIVLNPFVPNRYLNLEHGSTQILGAARTVRNGDPARHPQPLHPEPGGLFPCAVTEDGDTLYWVTRGAPDAWHTALRRAANADLVTYPLTVTQFLTAWLGGGSIAEVFRRDAENASPFPFPFPEFIPFRKTSLLTAYLAPVADDFEARLIRLMRHFDARHVKSRFRGWQGFNQCSFRGGATEVLIVYLDDAEFGSRLELHVPRSARGWAEPRLAQIPDALGIPFRRPAGATADFTWVEGPGGDEDDA